MLTAETSDVKLHPMTYITGQIIDEFGVKFEIQLWSIEEILKKVTLSCDFEEFDGTPSMWAYLLASKGGDVQTPALLEKILEEGFRDPICIWRDHYGAYGIGNGHHRLTCAILLGLDEIPVLISETPEEYYPDASEGKLDVTNEDAEVADWLYASYTKTYKKLCVQEQKVELDEIQLYR